MSIRHLLHLLKQILSLSNMIHQWETVHYTAISPRHYRRVFNSSGPFVLFVNQFCNKNIGIIYLVKNLYFTYGRFVKQERNSRLVKRQEMGGYDHAS